MLATDYTDSFPKTSKNVGQLNQNYHSAFTIQINFIRKLRQVQQKILSSFECLKFLGICQWLIASRRHILSAFFKVAPMGLYLIQHMFYIVHRDIFSVKLSNRSLFLDVPSWRHGPWTSVKSGVKACRFFNQLLPKILTA